MKPGPKRTPTKTLAMRGSWLANQRQGEPQPMGKMPECPSWLDADAREEWARAVVELEAMGVIGATDYAVMVGYCQSWSQYRAAVVELAKTGSLHEPRNDGESRRHPLTFILKDAREAMLKFARELGLSPSSRAGVSAISNGGEEDPLAILLRKRGSLN